VPTIQAIVQSKSKRVVCGRRHHPGGRERAENAERRDRDRRPAEPAPADVHATVEEDQHERHDSNPLDVLDRQVLGHFRSELPSESCREEEERRGRHPRRRTRLVRDDREHEPARDDEHELAVVEDLVGDLQRFPGRVSRARSRLALAAGDLSPPRERHHTALVAKIYPLRVWLRGATTR
jgi:hypothetical protein